MSMIDGQTTIQEIIWVIPQRELQVMRALHRLHASGQILFADLAEVGNAAVGLDVDLEPSADTDRDPTVELGAGPVEPARPTHED